METPLSTEKYVISLDAIDLSFLPICKFFPRQSNTIKPVWSKANLSLKNEDSYYEFEVQCRDGAETNASENFTDRYKLPIMETPLSTEKYVISLDAIDLSFLPICKFFPRQSNTIKPVWSKANLSLKNEDSYYEFEVQCRDGAETNASENFTDSSSCTEVDVKCDTYICYTCNLEVPQPYMIEHINSSKHEMFLMIANIALERVKRNMSQNYYLKTSKSSCSMFFCEICVLVVFAKDKSFHLESELHKSAVRKEKTFKDLLKVYTNEEMKLDDDKYNEIDKAANESQPENVHNIGNNTLQSRNLYEFHEVTNQNIDQAKLDKLKSAIPNDAKMSKINNTKTVSNELISADYINIVNVNTKSTHTLKSIDERNLQIETKDGCMINVELNNFHGIVEADKARYECKLCSDIFKNKKTHILSKKHMEKISLPIQDEHCIREVDTAKIYCIICNKVIENSVTHTISNRDHKKRLKQSIVVSKEDNGNSEILKIQQSESENINNPNAKCEDERIHYEELQIKISDKDDVSQNYKSNCKMSNSKEACCDVCNIVIHINNLHSHADGQRHKTREKHSVHYLMKKPPDVHYFTCKICNIPITLEEIRGHLLDCEHVYHYETLLAVNEISVINNNELYCELCCMFMVKGNEVCHVYSKRHLALLKQTRGEKSDTLSLTTTSKFDNDECSDTPVDDIILVKKRKNSDIYFCEICRVEVPNNPDNIFTHESGIKHKNYLSEIKTENLSEKGDGLRKIEDSQQYDINKVNCKKEVTNSSADNTKTYKPVNNYELKKENHNNLIAVDHHVAEENKIHNHTSSSAIYKEIQNNNTISKHNKKAPNDTSKKNKQDKVKSVELNDYFNVMEITSNAKEMLCKICKVKVPNRPTNVNEHLDGSNHNSNVSQFLEQNRLKNKGDIFYCEFCRDHLAIETQFTHTECRAHQRNMMKNRTQITRDRTVKTEKVSEEINTVQGKSLKKFDSEKCNNKPSTSKAVTSTNNVTEALSETQYFGMMLTEKPHELHCQVCDVQVSNNIATIKMHINGSNHISRKELLLVINEMISHWKSYYCLLCGTCLEERSFFNHLADEDHLANFSERMSSKTINDFCYVCETPIGEIFNMFEHTLTDEHIDNYRLMTKHRSYLCEICGVLLTNNESNVQEHEAGSQHQKNLRLIEENDLVIKDDGYYCRKCDKHFLCLFAIEHIQSAQHVSRLLTGM